MGKFFVLKKRKDFLRAAKDITIVCKNVVVQAAHPLSDGNVLPARIGFTATKRLGKAHIRNRTKRRLRAVIREMYDNLALKGVDYVLVGRMGTAACPYADLKRDIMYAFKKINKLILTEVKTNEKDNYLVD